MICHQEPGTRNRSRRSCATKVVWLYSAMSLNGLPPKKPERQEAHVFNFYTMGKRIAATAALGALIIAGTLQPAHAQGAAAPAKTYKPGEYEMYDGALKA